MKKLLASIIILIIATTVSFAQTNENSEIKTIDTETIINTEVAASSKIKAKVIKLNRKKSNEIISIKAYRKSLQIKVKTKKLC
ncbi:hypothetical protein [Winogradskyella flava]|uniref:Uncharacterized protein n=1 Tax=Winogradskyella flava TaxID=1884876 RepID=A0A842IR15_9FLAO|nr:hypothetical protein [Winogradskyella flava]MBC2844174.1 hypothetical protein [Winogradskyella flava]